MWWNFTEERKKFRAENGYPANVPQEAQYEILGYKQKEKKAVTNIGYSKHKLKY